MKTARQLTTLAECVQIASDLYDEYRNSRVKKNAFTHLCHSSYPLGIWFRGEEYRRGTVLTPSVFRTDNRGRQYDETRLFSFGRTRFPMEYHAAKGSQAIFPSLVHMQHFGLPTRLLDWSESLISALFFAVQNIDSEHPGLLHVLNARKLNRITGFTSRPINLHDEESFGTVFRCLFAESRTADEWFTKAGKYAKDAAFRWTDRDMPPKIRDDTTTHRDTLVPLAALTYMATPVAVMPGLVHARLKSQHGTFTLHGGKMPKKRSTSRTGLPKPLLLTELSQRQKPEHQFLRTYIIPRGAKERIKRELLALGVRAGTLYPEPDKQAEHLREMFRL